MTLATLTRRKLDADRRPPAADRLLVLRTAAWLLAVDVGLRTVGFTRLRRWLGRTPQATEAPTPPTPPPPLTPHEAEEARRLLAVVARASRLRFYRVGCLPRALVLQRLLGRRGLPSELRIGVRREAGSLAAHAWVECQGLALDPEPRAAGRFAPLR